MISSCKKINSLLILFIAIKALVLILLLNLSAMALVPPGIDMPSLRLPDTNGQMYNISEMIKGKVALIIYWSISCPHCREQVPNLQIMAKRFEGNPFLFIFINMDGQAMHQAIANYAIEHNFPKPWLIDVGPNDSVPFASYFNIMATPGVLVFDKLSKMIKSQEFKIDISLISTFIEKIF